MMFTKKKLLETTPFAEFIRSANSAEKKRVYSDVLKKAVDRQINTLRKADTP